MPGKGFKLLDAHVEVHGDGSKVTGDVARDMQASGGKGMAAGLGFGKRIVGGILGAVAVAGIGKFIGSAISEASDLNETVSAAGVIFGKQADAMEKWASSAATNFGLSKGAALGYATGLGDMFSQIGFTGTEAAKSSQSVVQMAADLGSFKNLETGDVLDRITGALRGEYDSLQAVIPNINAARVEKEALAATGKKLASELTAEEKAQAVLTIINKDGTRAMGDFTRTSEGYANQQKIAAAQTADLKAAVGVGLLPMMGALAGVVTGTVMPALIGLANDGLPIVSNGVADIIGWFTDWRTHLSDFVTWAKGTSIGGAIVASFPALLDVGGRVVALFVDKLWPAVQNIAASLQSAAQQTGISTWGLLVGVFMTLLPVIEFLAGVLLKVSNFMRDNQGVVNTLLIGYTAFRLAMMAQAAVSAISTAALAAQATGTGFLGAVMGASSIKTGIATAAQWLFNAAMTANPIGLVILGIVALIAIIVLLVTNWDTVVKWITEVWGGFIGWITDGLNAFGAWWVSLWAGFGSWVTSVWQGFIGWITAVWGGFIGWLKGVGNGIATWWNGLWAGVGRVISSVWAGIVGFVTAYIGLVRAVIFAVVGAVVSWWGSTWRGIATTIGAIWAGIVTGVSTNVGKVVGFVKGIKDKVFGALAGAGSWLVNTGKNIMDGLSKGIRNGIDGVISFIKSMGGNIVDAAKAVLGIHSPSTVMADQVGEHIPAGVGVGAKKAMPKLKSQIGRLLGDAGLGDVGVNLTASQSVGRQTAAATSADVYLTVESIVLDANDIDSVQKAIKMLTELAQVARQGRGISVGMAR